MDAFYPGTYWLFAPLISACKPRGFAWVGRGFRCALTQERQRDRTAFRRHESVVSGGRGQVAIHGESVGG
jgi:hypothetical protein